MIEGMRVHEETEARESERLASVRVGTEKRFKNCAYVFTNVRMNAREKEGERERDRQKDYQQ